MQVSIVEYRHQNRPHEMWPCYVVPSLSSFRTSLANDATSDPQSQLQNSLQQDLRPLSCPSTSLLIQIHLNLKSSPFQLIPFQQTQPKHLPNSKFYQMSPFKNPTHKSCYNLSLYFTVSATSARLKKSLRRCLSKGDR